MTTTKPKPTPQGISALLTDAGFELGVDAGNFGPGSTDGYAVFANRPGDGIVLVCWWGPEDELDAMFGRYTETIEGAGYRVRQANDGTYLIVTAPSGAEEDRHG